MGIGVVRRAALGVEEFSDRVEVEEDMAEIAGRYVHVVLGCGGIGSAAAYWLSQRGPGPILALEQFALGHDKGASEDHSRIIRHAYHTTDYTSLTDAAYAAWRQIEEKTGLALVLTTGGLDVGIGTAGEVEIASYEAALRATGHSSEALMPRARHLPPDTFI